MERVSCYIDGFNLYHAIDSVGKNHLKWIDLRRLATMFLDSSIHELNGVYYFSAFATWRSEAYKRHREYVRALKTAGVTPVMSEFYEKRNRCRNCNSSWIEHEEKQSDVKIALWMIDDAYQDKYDRALLISRDSDLSPAVRLLHSRFPEKKVYVIAPPNRRHSKALAKTVPRKNLRTIKEVHLARSLFGEKVLSSDGQIAATRPVKYTPI